MNILIENALVLAMDGGRSSGGGPVFSGSVGIEGSRITMVTRDDAAGAAAVEAFRRKHSGGNAHGEPTPSREQSELAQGLPRREGGRRSQLACTSSRTEGHCEEAGGEGGDLKVIPGRDRLVMPGLVNIHNHTPMSLMRSMADDIPLMDWLNKYIWPAEQKLTRELIILGAQLAIAEMLLGGTTSFVDLYWMQEAVGRAAEQAGMRAVLCPTMIDFKRDDFERDVEATFSRYAAGQCSTVSVMAGAHSPYSCSRENLLRVRQLAEQYGVGVNIHLAETTDEAAIIRELYGMTPVEYADSLGLLTPRSIAVHCVHLSESDIAILARSGASVAHNPQSNMKIGNGAAPVARMAAAGINVGLGTDGPCSNNDLDMIEEMRTATLLQKLATGDPLALPASEALLMATANGARAIGRGDTLGRIEEGMTADIVLLDTRKAHLYPQLDMVGNLVYAAKAADVDTVIVDGRVVVEGRRLLTLDLDAILAEVAKVRW